jgi:hypothetical protein
LSLTKGVIRHHRARADSLKRCGVVMTTSADEAITLRATIIGGISYADDYQVIWRGLSIGQIMRAPGLPPHVAQWRWTTGKPGGGQRIGQRSRRLQGPVPGGMDAHRRRAHRRRHARAQRYAEASAEALVRYDRKGWK